MQSDLCTMYEECARCELNCTLDDCHPGSLDDSSELYMNMLLTLGTHAQRGLQYLVCKSVRPSVCYHVFCHYPQQGGQKATPTGSVPHWLEFKNGDFRKSTAFKSYGVKKPIILC